MLAAAQAEIRGKFEVRQRWPRASFCLALRRRSPAPPLASSRTADCFWSLMAQEARAVSDPEQREQLLAEGIETADFIRSSIVQAAANERGAFGELLLMTPQFLLDRRVRMPQQGANVPAFGCRSVRYAPLQPSLACSLVRLHADVQR